MGILEIGKFRKKFIFFVPICNLLGRSNEGGDTIGISIHKLGLEYKRETIRTLGVIKF